MTLSANGYVTREVVEARDFGCAGARYVARHFTQEGYEEGGLVCRSQHGAYAWSCSNETGEHVRARSRPVRMPAPPIE